MLLFLLAFLVAVEGLALLAGACFFLTQIFVQETTSLSGSIVIFVITLVIAVGLLVTAYSTARGNGWVRGAILTWQILQLAIATSFFQGKDPWPMVGWILLALSITATLLLFSRSVQSVTTKR